MAQILSILISHESQNPKGFQKVPGGPKSCKPRKASKRHVCNTVYLVFASWMRFVTQDLESVCFKSQTRHRTHNTHNCRIIKSHPGCEPNFVKSLLGLSPPWLTQSPAGKGCRVNLFIQLDCTTLTQKNLTGKRKQSVWSLL